jgi:hypothetical protein
MYKMYRYFFSFLLLFNVLLYYNLLGSILYLIIKGESLHNAKKTLLETEYMALVSVLLSIIVRDFFNNRLAAL